MELPQLCHVSQPRLEVLQVGLAGVNQKRVAQKYRSALQAGKKAQ